MLITKTCMFTGKENTLDIDVTQEQLDAWKNGMLIQDAMPHLSLDDREFLISGVLPDVWDREFKEELDEMDAEDQYYHNQQEGH